MTNKHLPFLFCILLTCLWPVSIPAAQDLKPDRIFSSVDDEIGYYLTEESYTLRDRDALSVDRKAIARARFLSRNYEALFIEKAKRHLGQASGYKLSHLIWILLPVSGSDFRPLLVLASLDSFEKTFQNAQEIRLELVQKLTRHREPQSIHAVEALAALKYRPAIPEIVAFLNYPANPDVVANLTALADLGATKEVAAYVQQKVFEDLCVQKDYNVRQGIRTDLLLRSLRTIVDGKQSAHAAYFRVVLKNLVTEPDEKALIRYALEGESERLRGHSVLLLSHHRSEPALKVILDRLENDPNPLVRVWAAQSFVRHPNLRAVDTLVSVYEQSENYEVRFGCIEALGIIGGDKAVATLTRALDDKSPLVRNSAKFRLQQLSLR